MDMFMTKQLKQSNESNFKKISKEIYDFFAGIWFIIYKLPKLKRQPVVIKNHKRSNIR